MDPKKMFSKELASKVRGQIDKEIICDTVDQFFKQGNAFLLLEIIKLRCEVNTLKERNEHQYKKADTLRKLLVK
jgi:hypothetical protein